MKTQKIQLLRLQQIRVLQLWFGTFSSDFTLSVSDTCISDKTADIQHQNDESEFQ